MERLNGKVAIITGAAQGVGLCAVKMFLNEGAKVVATDINDEKLFKVIEELGTPDAVAVKHNVSSEEDWKKVIETAVSTFGKLDVLVNNAGVMDDMAAMANVTDEKYEYVMGINVYGPLCSMRKACQVFLEQGNGGNIINVSSVGSMHQAAGPVYCASKAAVNAYSRSVAYTYMKEGIRCNVIAPGGISTEIGTAMGMPNMDGYGRVKPVQALSPAPGKTDDIANTALFLASDDSTYISGVILPVDGGWTSF